MLTAWSTSQFRLRLVELDIDRSDITIRQNGKGIRKDGDTACMPTSPSPGFEEAGAFACVHCSYVILGTYETIGCCHACIQCKSGGIVPKCNAGM